MPDDKPEVSKADEKIANAVVDAHRAARTPVDIADVAEACAFAREEGRREERERCERITRAVAALSALEAEVAALAESRRLDREAMKDAHDLSRWPTT